jgi:hypothetical protein
MCTHDPFIFLLSSRYLESNWFVHHHTNHQIIIDLFRYGWIHLHTAIVKEVSVSHQSSIDHFNRPILG